MAALPELLRRSGLRIDSATPKHGSLEREVTVTTSEKKLAKNTVAFWCTLAIALGIIGIGANFILNPAGASAGYGIPNRDPAAVPYLWVKGIRDIFAGLVLLPFLLRGDRRTTGMILAIAILIPVGDGLVIFNTLGWAPPMLIHWGTALFMAVLAYFLLRAPPARRPVSP